MRSKLLSILKKDGIKTEYLEIHKRNLLSKNNTVKKVDVRLLSIEDIINIGLAHAVFMHSSELFVSVQSMNKQQVQWIQVSIGADNQRQLTMYFYKGPYKYNELIDQVDVYGSVALSGRRKLRVNLRLTDQCPRSNVVHYNLTPLLS